MENKKEMTAPNVSVGADTEQSIQKCTDISINDNDENIKDLDESFREMQREMLRQMDPSYLKTVSMSALYDTDFETQTTLIDGLLYQGTYLFVGSPKVGKSFMMAQLAYHISTGTPLWNYRVRNATVLYFALEDDYPRLQRRLYHMFGADGTDNLYFATESKTVNGGLEDQIRGFIQEHPDTGLIIIDTLKRVRETGGADYSYGSDYDVVAKLKALADSYKVTMLIVSITHANSRLTINLIQSPAQTDCSVRQTAPLFSAKRNEQPMPQRLTSPAEISRISEYTLFAIRKNLYGNLKKAKQKFGQSRLTRCLKRYRLFFLRTVADGTGRLLN